MASLTVLGSCGAYPEAGRAASGFLLSDGNTRIVLDLGYATVPRLLGHCPGGEVTAVVITHEHADHCADLHALLRVRLYGSRGAPRIPLYCPPGVIARVQALDPSERIDAAFDVHALPDTANLGSFRLDSFPLPHHVPNVGVRLSNGDVTLAYTGDSGPDPALVDLGRDADLYVMEATRQGPRTERFLLTATEAGRYAARAGARRLMLTHLWPGSDPEVSTAEAAANYPGGIIVATEDLVVPLVSG